MEPSLLSMVISFASIEGCNMTIELSLSSLSSGILDLRAVALLFLVKYDSPFLNWLMNFDIGTWLTTFCYSNPSFIELKTVVFMACSWKWIGRSCCVFKLMIAWLFYLLCSSKLGCFGGRTIFGPIVIRSYEWRSVTVLKFSAERFFLRKLLLLRLNDLFAMMVAIASSFCLSFWVWYKLFFSEVSDLFERKVSIGFINLSVANGYWMEFFLLAFSFDANLRLELRLEAISGDLKLLCGVRFWWGAIIWGLSKYIVITFFICNTACSIKPGSMLTIPSICSFYNLNVNTLAAAWMRNWLST